MCPTESASISLVVYNFHVVDSHYFVLIQREQTSIPKLCVDRSASMLINI